AEHVTESLESLAERVRASEATLPVSTHQFIDTPVLVFPSRLLPCSLLRQHARAEPLFNVAGQSASWIASSLAAGMHSELHNAANRAGPHRRRVAVPADALPEVRSRLESLAFPDAVQCEAMEVAIDEEICRVEDHLLTVFSSARSLQIVAGSWVRGNG